MFGKIKYHKWFVLQRVFTMAISNIDKLIRDEVISVMSWTRSCHGQAVQIESSCDNSENGHALKWKGHKNLLYFLEVLYFVWILNKWCLQTKIVLQAWHLVAHLCTYYYVKLAFDTMGSSLTSWNVTFVSVNSTTT